MPTRTMNDLTNGIEKCYRNKATDLVDLLFDKEFLASDLSRESIDWLEDYIALIISQTAIGAARATELLVKMKTRTSL